jgi:L-idonate 5-dehydrogenase
MTAIVIHAAKDLRLESQSPQQPDDGQVAIDISIGGICGSDLHYYQHGGFGTVRLKQPMILGHEVAGRIAKLGNGITHLEPGQPVAINPSRPCQHCEFCLQGLQIHCHDMKFYGSAMPFPHVQGAFAQSLIVDANQCIPLSTDTSMNVAAFAEPFSVALHAVKRAGSLHGKRVLVTGCGPIGGAVVVAARYHGARDIVATDVLDNPLAYALKAGADRVVNVADDESALAVPEGQKGLFDVMIEASGNEAAVRLGLGVLKPRGILVQLGLGGEMTLAQNLVVSKEIEIRGSFRFHTEFELAVDLLSRGRVDVSPLISDTFHWRDAVAAFDTAGDRSRAMKVQIDFSRD